MSILPWLVIVLAGFCFVLNFGVKVHDHIQRWTAADGRARAIAERLAPALNAVNDHNRALLTLHVICLTPASAAPPALAALRAQGEALRIQQEIAWRRAQLLARAAQVEGQFAWHDRTRLPGPCGLPGLLPLTAVGGNEIMAFRSQHAGFHVVERWPYGSVAWAFYREDVLPLSEGTP
jgi:hypothetical protein